MYDVVAIGNISADLYFNADELTHQGNRLNLAIGGKYQVSEFSMHVGGGGANVAIGCRRMGLRSAVVGMVGNNAFRKAIMQRLEQAKVATRYILFNQKDSSVAVILLGSNGERTIIHHESSHKHTVEEKHVLHHIKGARAVYFGNMPDVSAHERRSVMKRLHEQGSFIVCNVGKKDCCRPRTYTSELLEYADMLIVNTFEFCELIKQPDLKINFKKSVFEYMPQMKDKLVVITDSSNGSYAYFGDKVYHQKAIQPRRIIDTTGAGDAYSAGFISSYITYLDIPRAMKNGASYASKILARIGAN